ncbi:MAG TPA: alanine--tRNA ligase [Candidatus Omnitrophota bacterium]|nr:alanine--tRNA ligase [Candidatus Omnitrophota bacterium]HPD85301.1 alanine--tRNA ligase [Candidatus Omnitrophota bacterium]HRZ04198.1 alanine--tRNA ligase [Candidatus Omnitrophota bacterium]
MNADLIRKKFLDFFASKKHTIIASDSLVPKDDPTVLFTTAGMQQFKRQFLGQIDGYTRAATSQKCLRTDDLDRVGKTNFHHTFFEMLGNFSFGDYFKKEAIEWAWEFLTKEVKIPADRLWVSVYKEDQEAEKIWLEDIKIPAQKLVRLGDKSNFWPSEAKTKGPNGPCGPCSEIFYDYGPETGCGKADCSPECDCGRFAEIWNLVFTQFNRKEDGSLEPLPNKNIDTGMGFERLAAVLQGKKNNFETDLFEPIIEAIDKETNAHKDKYTLDITDKRIIADHIRAVTFGINDGVIPSNEGRGYVIKRLIIDATDKMIPLGKTGTRLYKLVPVVVSAMKAPYPELQNKMNDITGMIQKIQESYLVTRDERIPELKQKIRSLKDLALDEKAKKMGKVLFEYRDTYGVTFSTIKKIVEEEFGEELEFGKNVVVESYKFSEYLMEEQRNRSRAASKMTGDVFADAELNLNVPKTEFLGYNDFSSRGKILKIFIGNKEVAEAKKDDAIKIVLDRTPFYAESGGQVGDTGIIKKNDSAIKITGTRKIADVFIHSGTVEEGIFHPGDFVDAQIDAQRRLSVMRNHTATHLLQAALRNVLGGHIQQQGSLVDEDRLRFDFTHPKGLSQEDIAKIEASVNLSILNCYKVDKKTMSLNEAKDAGALAFFAEKYGDTVRVVAVSDYSKELCGGTHLETTGQIGLFKIVAESAIAQGIRRIEAVTGTHALDFIRSKEEQIDTISQILKVPASEIVPRVEAQVKQLKEFEKEAEELRFEIIRGSLEGVIRSVKLVKNIYLVRHIFENVEFTALRKIADVIKQRMKSVCVAIASKHDGNAFLLVMVTDDLVQKGIRADAIIKDIAPLINGSGGGRPQLAQAGSKETSGLEEALKKVERLI